MKSLAISEETLYVSRSPLSDLEAVNAPIVRADQKMTMRSLVILIGLCAVTLFAGLGSSRLWDRDEPRNARCAVEMLTVNDWIVPTFNGELRTHKPILLYWVQMLSYTALGINDFAARFGSALAGLTTVLIVYWLGTMLADERTGFWSAATLGTSLMFIVASRADTPDALLICFSTIAIAMFVRYFVRHFAREGQGNQYYLWGGYAALGFAVLAKGPVGIVLPGAVIAAWVFCELHIRRRLELAKAATEAARLDRKQRLEEGAIKSSRLVLPVRTWHHPRGLAAVWNKVVTQIVDAIRSTCKIFWQAACDWKTYIETWKCLKPVRGMLIALIVALPWHLWVGYRTDGAWLRGFFWEHNVGRALGAMEGHQAGVWFYPVVMLAGLFPWSLVLIPILMWSYGRCTNKTHSLHLFRLAAVWIAVYVVAFSLAKTKLPSYITPCYSGAVLIIGGCLADWSRGRFRVHRGWMMVVSLVTLLTGLSIGAAILYSGNQLQSWQVSQQALWCIGILTVAGLAMYWRREVARQAYLPAGFAAAFALLIFGVYTFAAPAVDMCRADLDLILADQHAVSPDGQASSVHENDWLCIGTLEPSWIYYANHRIREIPAHQSSSDDSDHTSDWRSVAREHLQRPSARLLIPGSLVGELERYLSATQSDIATEVTQAPRFMRRDTLAILRPVPQSSHVRLSQMPPSDR